MTSAHPGKTVADTVTAVYADESALSFKLLPDATLGDLATQLASWGEGHGGLPLYVGVTFRDAVARL
jgi:hypothetical protein